MFLSICLIFYQFQPGVAYITKLNEIDICNFADDTTPYVCDSNLKSVLEKLEHNSELAIAWFEMDYMKLNTDKCHPLKSGNKKDIIWERNDVELLVFTI